MLFREAIASVLATVLFFLLVMLALLTHSDPDANDSWQRGVAIAPVLFIIAVATTWACGQYLLSKGLCTPLKFIAGAFALSAGAVVVLITPAIVIGSIIGFFPWVSSFLSGLVIALTAAVASIPSAVIWWWIVAHNQ
ncbi:hypothetical protein [Methylophaga sp.]|uniref:hypothetical protein n=1 Tax=Methylophaga sp. TaxID=2024840 RepID=UPI00272904E0|nr:hypothetical protein [Methylophaga sp.]MDO8826153.1 hypothetical protein [Methylophaga sp.]